MDIGECGVCGRWAAGLRFPSGNRRPDGTTPMDNFICYRCQEEALSDIRRRQFLIQGKRAAPQSQT
jgi:hypothetical protein